MTMKLYYAPGTIALACHIALAEAGAEYEAMALDFTRNEQRSEAYLAINPKGRVPALITDRGILTKRRRSSPSLRRSFRRAPRATGRHLCFRRAAILPGLSLLDHACRDRALPAGSRWADQESSFADMRAKVPQNTRDCCRLIEDEYLDGPWVMGADYTIADPYLFHARRMARRFGIELNEFPKIAAHWQAMQARPAVRRALAEQATA